MVDPSDRTPVPADPLPGDAPAHPRLPDLDLLAPRRARALLGWMAVGVALALLATFALPRSTYVQWQQAEGTILFHAPWVYQRIADDPAPIAVAVVGTSRLEAGISPAVLQHSLSAALHRPVPVANLSLVQTGRDLHYEIVRLLLDHHPEVRVVALALDGDTSSSHPFFRYVASPADLLGSRVILNFDYIENLFFLPYRNVSVGLQTLAPELFGVRTRFDPAAYRGRDLDRTLGYRTPAGALVNGDQTAPPGALLAYAEGVVAAHRSTLRFQHALSADARLPVERWAVRRIAALCRRKHVRMLFVRLPMFGVEERPSDLAFYRRYGPILSPAATGTDPALYANGAHLNRTGAIAASQWLGKSLTPYLSAP